MKKESAKVYSVPEIEPRPHHGEFKEHEFWWSAFHDGERNLSDLSAGKFTKCDIHIDSDAFAFAAVSREYELLGQDNNPRLMNPSEQGAWLRRFNAWKLARYDWHRYLVGKEFPAAQVENAKTSEAAWAGYFFNNTRKTPDRRTQIMIERVRENRASHFTFIKTIEHEQRLGWNYPQLDSWLILIWPLVNEFKWNYADVLRVTSKRFHCAVAPKVADPTIKPLFNIKAFKGHLKMLGLKISSPKRGNSTLPKLAEMALEIPPRLPANSHFYKRGN